jgi:hypothetical protein
MLSASLISVSISAPLVSFQCCCCCCCCCGSDADADADPAGELQAVMLSLSDSNCSGMMNPESSLLCTFRLGMGGGFKKPGKGADSRIDCRAAPPAGRTEGI